VSAKRATCYDSAGVCFAISANLRMMNQWPLDSNNGRKRIRAGAFASYISGCVMPGASGIISASGAFTELYSLTCAANPKSAYPVASPAFDLGCGSGRVMARMLGQNSLFYESSIESKARVETGLAIAQQAENQAESAFCRWRLAVAAHLSGDLIAAIPSFAASSQRTRVEESTL
jgi:hypothetical protein